MKKIGLFLFLTTAFTQASLACDPQTGERIQRVYAEWNGKRLGFWDVTSDEPKTFELSNGLKLGIQIEEASAEKYKELKDAWPHTPEMVSIRLFDMSSNPNKQLAMTWGGANSIQGYSDKGGATSVKELGSPGLTLHLMKSVCV
ncbi:hypothetical protein [Kangiella shandongensis]|uniref:hypothetical protein n=1 Tax=Kangiella shandongensis TaxID=2763258 RepID=UPI001CBECF0B|nr:hypothetical protein [Kangiella shandongensis]